MLSSIDLVRGLAGLPLAHPATLPHVDRRLEVEWSDEVALPTDGSTDALPDSSGVFSLIAGRPGAPDRVVWSEAVADIRARVAEMLVKPWLQPEPLRSWLESGHLRVRWALLPLGGASTRVVDALQRAAGLARGV